MPASSRSVVIILVAGAMFGTLIPGIYFPAAGDIARSLGANDRLFEIGVSGYFAAYAASSLLVGPIADQLGGRCILILALFFIASNALLCAVTSSSELIMAALILQGIGTCATGIVGRSIAVELFDRESAVEALATLGMALPLAQAAAPFIGAQLEIWIGWRANFAGVGTLALLVLGGCILYVPSATAKVNPRDRFVRGAVEAYRTLISSRQFIGYSLVVAACGLGSRVFLSVGPIMLTSYFAVTPSELGNLAALPALGYIAGSYLSGRSVRWFGADLLIRSGLAVLVCASAVMFGLAVAGRLTLLAFAMSVFFISLGSGLVTPNATALNLERVPGSRSAASGLSMFALLGSAAAASAGLSIAPNYDPTGLAAVIAASGLLAVGIYIGLIRAEVAYPEDRG
jgi:DHA1 family bicyclomycin/chloramphenicol resistance-like MFS transporter